MNWYPTAHTKPIRTDRKILLYRQHVHTHTAIVLGYYDSENNEYYGVDGSEIKFVTKFCEFQPPGATG